MKIKHEHIESVLFALAAEKGQAWVANAITEEYLRQGGGELPLVPGKDWNNQQNIYHRWLKGETKTQREKIQKLIPAILAILPRELRHRLCIFDTVADVMSALHASYDDGQSGEKFLRELCEVDLLVLDEIGIQRETKNEQVVLHQIVDRRTASMRSVGMLTNLNYEAMKTLLGERIMDRMTMNGGRWVNFNWESWRPNVVQPGIAK